MYVTRSEYLGRYRARRTERVEGESKPSALERAAAEGERLRGKARIREVSPSVATFVAYPWVCFGCGSHMRHGDLCAFCGERGRRVVRRREAGPAGLGRGRFAGYWRDGERRRW